MSCPPATAVMLWVSPTLVMLRGAVGHVPGESEGALWVGHLHTCPNKSHIAPLCSRSHLTAPTALPIRLPAIPRTGAGDALALWSPTSLAAPQHSLLPPSLLHRWDHATLDADVETLAVLPSGASSQADIQASVGHLRQSQEREKLRHEKKMQVGRRKRSPYLSALNVEGALVARHEPGPCQQSSILLPGDRGHRDACHHTRQL